jgi:aspartyl-tRNA(Asn)/glutamyl-tRNA(Gln) amidotransferase subunit C
MSAPDEAEVRHIAQLARLHLTGEELARLQRQLHDVLNYVEKLKEVDVSGVETSTHAVPMFNVVREDEPRPGLTAEEALSNAPRQANHLFIVPKVIE